MADYAEATADYDLVDTTLRRAGRPVYLPAVQPAPVVVHQPVPVQRAPGFDVASLRLASAGVCAVGVGGGIYLGGLGIHEAGPYLPWLAGSLAAFAAVVAALKSKASSGSSGTTVNFNGGKNRVGRIG